MTTFVVRLEKNQIRLASLNLRSWTILFRSFKELSKVTVARSSEISTTWKLFYRVELARVLIVLRGVQKPLWLPPRMALLNPFLNWSPRKAYKTGFVALLPYIRTWKQDCMMYMYLPVKNKKIEMSTCTSLWQFNLQKIKLRDKIFHIGLFLNIVLQKLFLDHSRKVRSQYGL